MSNLPAWADPGRWHGLIERRTPDRLVGRIAVALLALVGGGFLFFAGLTQAFGDFSGFVLVEVGGLLAAAVGLPAMVAGLVVLWPVYLALRGRVEAVKTYTHGGTEFGDRPADETDPVELLKRRYAAGDLTEAEFERRLDGVLDAEAEAAADVRRPSDGPGDGERSDAVADAELE